MPGCKFQVELETREFLFLAGGRPSPSPFYRGGCDGLDITEKKRRRCRHRSSRVGVRVRTEFPSFWARMAGALTLSLSVTAQVRPEVVVDCGGRRRSRLDLTVTHFPWRTIAPRLHFFPSLLRPRPPNFDPPTIISTRS
jgi:hypothetical protein